MYLARSIVFYSIISCIVFFQKFKNPAQNKYNPPFNDLISQARMLFLPFFYFLVVSEF